MSKRFVCKPMIAIVVGVTGIVGVLTATAVAQSQRFPDVPPEHYAFEAVEWAAEVGVTTGYTDNTFKPDRPLTKAHAWLFLERYYNEVFQANESEDFTRGQMMVLLKAINDGTGAGSSGESDTPQGFTAITAGTGHSCGLRTGGTAQCWGYDGDGEADVPLGAFTAITAGRDHSCGLRTGGTAKNTGATTTPVKAMRR